MIPLRQNTKGPPPQPWPGLDWDRQFLTYEDAESLKRGFQFWLGWPGTAVKTARFFPVCLAQAGDRTELDDVLRSSCDTALFILSFGSGDGTLSSGSAAKFLSLLERDRSKQRGLILLFPTTRALSRWPQASTFPADWDFSLGCYTAAALPNLNQRAEPNPRWFTSCSPFRINPALGQCNQTNVIT